MNAKILNKLVIKVIIDELRKNSDGLTITQLTNILMGWRKYKNEDVARKIVERILKNYLVEWGLVEKQGKKWVWKGSVNSLGYGTLADYYAQMQHSLKLVKGLYKAKEMDVTEYLYGFHPWHIVQIKNTVKNITKFLIDIIEYNDPYYESLNQHLRTEYQVLYKKMENLLDYIFKKTNIWNGDTDIINNFYRKTFKSGSYFFKSSDVTIEELESGSPDLRYYNQVLEHLIKRDERFREFIGDYSVYPILARFKEEADKGNKFDRDYILKVINDFKKVYKNFEEVVENIFEKWHKIRYEILKIIFRVESGKPFLKVCDICRSE